MQRYLISLEGWLNKWRMKITPKKCSFNIYCDNVLNLNTIPKRSLILFSVNIPLTKNPKYLEVTQVEQQLVVYKKLIRSSMEYVPQILIQFKNNVQMFQTIQNQALRIIYKQPLKASSESLHKIANIEMIEVRLNALVEKYWTNFMNSENELIQFLNIFT